MIGALRVALLLAGMVLALGSASQPSSSTLGPAGPAGQPPGAAPAGGYFCHAETQGGRTLSMCRPAYDACEGERQAAISGGFQTTGCTPVAAVACFQMGGDPAPAAEWCAASAQDCEAWRQLDEQKSGTTGACVWKQ